MELKKDAKTGWEFLIVLSLLVAFVIGAGMATLIGMSIYKNITEKMDQNFTRRTATSYIQTKLQQADQKGSISICEKEGQPVIVLKHNIEGTSYETWLYGNEGALKELYIEAGTNVTLEDGMEIMPIKALAIERLTPYLVKVMVTDLKDETISLIIPLRSKLI